MSVKDPIFSGTVTSSVLTTAIMVPSTMLSSPSRHIGLYSAMVGVGVSTCCCFSSLLNVVVAEQKRRTVSGRVASFFGSGPSKQEIEAEENSVQIAFFSGILNAITYGLLTGSMNIAFGLEVSALLLSVIAAPAIINGIAMKF